MDNSPSPLQVLGVVYGLLWCGSLARLGPFVPLQMILVNRTFSPRAPPDDSSDDFSFRVKGGLVIKFCFCVFPNDRLGVVCRVVDFHLLSIPTQ